MLSLVPGLFLDRDRAIQTGQRYGSANSEIGKTKDCCFCPDPQHKNNDSHKSKGLIRLPNGSPAWVCDKVLWEIYSEEYRKLRVGPNSPEGKVLTEIFREMGE